jgi:hypothetical protein
MKELQLIFQTRKDNIIIKNILAKKLILLLVDYLAKQYLNMVQIIVNIQEHGYNIFFDCNLELLHVQ